MAVTSIWRVKGRMSKVLEYIKNPEKTTNPDFYKNASPLDVVLAYATDKEKTEHGELTVKHRYVTGVNCYPDTAVEEMLAVKHRYGKEDGVIAYHGYQAFAPGEATPELAHEIGVRLAQRVWGDRFQVVVTTHLDKDNQLHNHFVVNTVSFVDGKKYHRTRQDYVDLRNASDEICQSLGLSVINNTAARKGKRYGELRAEQENRPTWRGIVKADVDEAIRQSMTEREFYARLEKMGYEYRFGKYLYLKPPGKPRFIRLSRQLGEDYTMEAIRSRILAQNKAEVQRRQNPPQPRQVYCRGIVKPVKQSKGFRGLYIHYCYLMGVFPRKRKSNRRMHFLLREDLLNLEHITQEARLLGEHRIDTAEQLSSYRAEQQAKLDELTQQRKALYKEQRYEHNESRKEEIRKETASISARMKLLRKEVRCCDRIAERSAVMEQRIAQIAQEEKQRKEMNEHEQQRRRRRTSRQA